MHMHEVWKKTHLAIVDTCTGFLFANQLVIFLKHFRWYKTLQAVYKIFLLTSRLAKYCCGNCPRLEGFL